MPQALDDKLQQLAQRGVAPQLCQLLGELLNNAPAATLARLSPPRLALQWQRDEGEVLAAFLHGTRLGLFELEWDLRCPSCTGPSTQTRHLDALGSEGHCEMCEIDYQVNFDQAVEVVWRVHPALRNLSDLSPMAVFAAYAQPQPLRALQLEPGASLQDQLELSPGNYHVLKADFSSVRGIRVDLDLDEPSPKIELVVDAQGIERGPWRRRAGTHDLALHNRSAAPLELLITRVTDLPWISAARLAAHQDFRDLFSAELIGPEQSFAIRHSAFVFTDIKGSTELYERIGDARAYALVRDHFALMINKVRDNNGAIVKTIGDAVMATFVSPAAAFAFARETIEAFDTFNSADKNRDDVIVKIGVHSGPCIAVTLNERLDYFGRTVNIAARVQGLSQGSDIVISQTLAENVEVQAALDDPAWQKQPFTAQLKGIAGDFSVIRVQRAAG